MLTEEKIFFKESLSIFDRKLEKANNVSIEHVNTVITFSFIYLNTFTLFSPHLFQAKQINDIIFCTYSQITNVVLV